MSSQILNGGGDVTRTLNFFAWNANGLKDRRNELEILLKFYQIDIALVSETHFTRESRLFFKGYKMYNAKHPSNNARGGASLLIRNEIKHNVVKCIETKHFQSVIVSVHTNLGTFNVAPVYCPPRFRITVNQYDNFFQNLGSRFLVGGDWNSKNVKWGSRLTTRKGKNLALSVAKFKGNYISPWKPTYYSYNKKNKPDLIDFFIFKNLNFHDKTTCNVTPDFKVDHLVVLLSVFTHPVFFDKAPSLVNNSTDWNQFRDVINERLWNEINVTAETKEEIDSEMERLTEIIQDAAKQSTKIAVNSCRPCKLPQGILKLIADKRAARRRWFESRYETDKKEFNRLNKIVQNKLSTYKFSKFENFVKNLSPNKHHDYSLWKATKYLKKPYQTSWPLRDKDDKWAISGQEKANVLAKHYEKVFQPHHVPENGEIEKPTISEPSLPEVRIKKITPSEISAEIKGKTKVRKAPGIDRINGMILKQLPWLAICKLSEIFNAILKEKYFPTQWKIAEIIVIAKAGKPPEDPASYRPISLLSAIGKLFERLYVKRLKKLVGARKLILDAQFGFRDRHSTVEQLHRVTSYIEEALENKEYCVAIFLDTMQAFDRVNHKKLIDKLSKVLPKNHVEILLSFLTNRKFRVRFEDAVSDFFPIKAGVPQGSVLSPLIYSLFTADIPEPEGNGKLGIFADDTVTLTKSKIYEEARNKAQNHLNAIHAWTTEDEQRMNASKSVEIVFTNKLYNHVPVALGGVPIPHEYSTRYLGLTLDAKLRYKEHVLKKKKEVWLKFKKMGWLLGKNSKLPLKIKILLYKVMLRPIWSYACQVWACTATSNFKLIEVLQNKILRVISGAHWYQRNVDIRTELGIESVESYVTTLASRYEERLLCHPNVEAIGLLDWVDKVRRLKRRKPWELTSYGFTKL